MAPEGGELLRRAAWGYDGLTLGNSLAKTTTFNSSLQPNIQADSLLTLDFTYGSTRSAT